MPLNILTKFLCIESSKVTGEQKGLDFKYFVRRKDNRNLFDQIPTEGTTLKELAESYWLSLIHI